MDDVALTFGKYKGKTPNQIAEIDPSYIVWMHDTVKPLYCSKELYIACRLDMDEDEADQGLDEAHLLGPKDW